MWFVYVGDPTEHLDKLMDEMVENTKTVFTTLSTTAYPDFAHRGFLQILLQDF